MMTKVQDGVCSAVAKHFGMSRARVKEIAEAALKVNGNSPVININLQDLLGVSVSVMCSKNTMPLSSMFFFNKLKKQIESWI